MATMNQLHYEYLKDYLALCDEYIKYVADFEIPEFEYVEDPNRPDWDEDCALDEHLDKWGSDENPKQMLYAASNIADEFRDNQLSQMNAKYIALGLDKGLVKTDLPMRPAIDGQSAWYNSSCF